MLTFVYSVLAFFFINFEQIFAHKEVLTENNEIFVKPNLTFSNPTGKYMLKVNNKSLILLYWLSSKLIIKTPEWRRSGVFIVNFEHISNLVLVFILLTLNRYMPTGIDQCVSFILYRKLYAVAIYKFGSFIVFLCWEHKGNWGWRRLLLLA